MRWFQASNENVRELWYHESSPCKEMSHSDKECTVKVAKFAVVEENDDDLMRTGRSLGLF